MVRGPGRKRNRVVVLVFLLLVVLATVTAGQVLLKPPRWLLRAVERIHPEAVFFVDTDARILALTIDDSPHPDVTPYILAALERHGARATFFVIGSYAEQYPEWVEAIRAAGHELGNHLYLDRRSSSLDADEFVRNLRRTDRLIDPDSEVKWCRPGSGTLDDRLTQLMLGNGYRPCLASVYPLDLTLPTRWARWQFEANARPGAILVLHDGSPDRRKTVAVLEEALPRLVEKGFRIVTVSELVASDR